MKHPFFQNVEVFKRVKKLSPKTDFIFLTANESTEVAVSSIKYGAFDYIIKDEVALAKKEYLSCDKCSFFTSHSFYNFAGIQIH